MRKGFHKPSFQDRVVDTFVSTAIRHVARKSIFAIDHYISFLQKDLSLTSIRCDSCFKLCRYNYDNKLYNCSHCGEPLNKRDVEKLHQNRIQLENKVFDFQEEPQFDQA